MKKSINALLSMRQHLVERKNQLNELKSMATRRNIFENLETGKRIEEPTYDIKLLDAKVMKLSNAVMLIDETIKEANYTTKVDIDIDLDNLMSPIE